MHVRRPSKRSIEPFFGFIQLFLYAEPTWVDKLCICLGVIAAVAAGVPFPLIGIVMGQLVDDLNDATCDSQAASASGTMDSINDNILLLVYIAVTLFFLIYTHIVCWNLVSQRLAQRIRDHYLRSLLRQDISFFDNLQAGEVSSRLNGDIQAIESGTCEKVGVFLTCVSFCVTAYVKQ
jgi:ABC-type multidrug transport system fused ATPase/permease subunit